MKIGHRVTFFMLSFLVFFVSVVGDRTNNDDTGFRSKYRVKVKVGMDDGDVHMMKSKENFI